ncbi:MAG: DUF5677 domain-containing protein [Candidatus Binatus sp.]|uniref:DUF5677 domain-containing protein n=1 Tax=Candidatus Binatus sp. TaxID=2811406 RepID=UPI00271B8E32|nr:DUF5677 domain-containing protein [Candidatus Binatus sp.]MDO8432187.1 DUF5677 domain-containing protein [Candidatus Binatus sp.]
MTFGRPDEQRSFVESHKLFFERFPNLAATMNLAFVRTMTNSGLADAVVFYLGRLCTDDFNEILLLCGNGYGSGAMKLLRGLYERVVTGRHLHTHPDECRDFLDFYWINAHRVARAIEDVFGKGQISAAKVAELEAKRAEVKSRYMVTSCKKCGTKRLNYTWSKLDFVSMARATGSTGKRLVDAYFLPMEQAHSTAGAIGSRLKEKPDGTITFDNESQRGLADRALITGHNLMLDMLCLQREHFGLVALDDPVAKCLKDFAEIWKRTEDQAQ